MKKTITRRVARQMYEALSQLPLGHLATEDLEKAMDNILALSATHEHHQKMMQELGKRLYDGIDEEKIRKFNTMLSMAQNAASIEKSVAIHKAAKAEYADLYELLEKQVKVENSLLAKEVEVDLNILEKRDFVKAILKGNPNIAVSDFELFAPMFAEEEAKAEATDFSELDELLTL